MGRLLNLPLFLHAAPFTFLLTEPFKIKGGITFATNEAVYLPNFLVDCERETSHA